jgi:hypothetical protein
MSEIFCIERTYIDQPCNRLMGVTDKGYHVVIDNLALPPSIDIWYDVAGSSGGAFGGAGPFIAMGFLAGISG